MSLHFNFGHIAGGPFTRPAVTSPTAADDHSTAATEELLGRASAFERAQSQVPDPIFAMRDAFLADPSEHKLNLCVGVYRTAAGKPLVLDVVQDAEQKLLEDQKAGRAFKEYLPPDGMAAFCEASVRILLGDAIQPAIDEKRLVTAQSLSGTGGLHLAARMLAAVQPGATIHLPSPTWPIHPGIFTAVGLRVAYYPYYEPATCGLAFDEMLAALHALPVGSIVLLHACAHNPTGVDPTPEQWDEIAQAVRARALVPIVDSAYQGLASGDLDADGYGARALARLPGIELIAVQSYAKNLGLYAERAGVLAMVCNDAEVAERVGQHLRRTIRVSHSSPPMHGAAIAATILCDPERTAHWKAELKAMADRLLEMRGALASALARVGCPPPTSGAGGTERRGRLATWQHIRAQKGMFTYIGLSAAHVAALRERHHVYMPHDGRICLAALTHESCATLAAALKDVLSAEARAARQRSDLEESDHGSEEEGEEDEMVGW